jgi:hypothetical protein
MMRIACAVIAASALLVATPSLSRPPKERDGGERSADQRDKMICKRFVETGSLIKGYRLCKTKWEWEQSRNDFRTLNVSDSCRTRGSGIGCG